MLNYKEYEKKVYDWLKKKNDEDPNFTFSLRQKGSKGAETDYFIGTEKSNYFSTSFWYLPVAFPGSSGDCMGLLFVYTKSGYNYFFEFTQTKTPHNDQNKAALYLVENLQVALQEKIGFQREPKLENKMFTLKTKTAKKSYSSVEEMFLDIDKDIKVILPTVDSTIAKVKKEYPDFKAHRLTQNEFKDIMLKFEERIKRFENETVSNDTIEDFRTFLQNFDAKDILVYFDFLKGALDYLKLDQGDSRLLFTYRDNGLRFTIGQRYAFYLNPKYKEGKFGILSKDKLNETSSPFAGQKVVPYFSYFNDFKPTAVEKQTILEGFEAELKRSKQSGYRNHNSSIFENAIFNHIIGNPIEIKQMETKDQQNTINKFPLNQILYGPPGTGKTYNTVLEAAKIVTGNKTINYTEALEVFKANLDNQIEFITFHQNYSYEDFIQGLRPDTENGNNLTFEKKDGVFKRIADKAFRNIEASKNPANAKREFTTVFQELIKPLNNGDIDEIEIKMKKSSFFITEVGEKSISFRKNVGDSEHTLSINTLHKMYDKGLNDIILGGLQPYYNPILDLLLENGKSQVTKVERKNYVIIIDEINRANISRVFGELITLIEKDKRSEGEIPMRVTLPSGDKFIVPSNLHIIGTMNTADKSIALLDIALRRRFEFVPMYPLYNGLEKPIHDAELLQKINDAILSRKNHDFTIGHAYFMGDDYTLENTINLKVIPLLLEYFMNDEKEVAAILQNAGITIGGWPLKMIS